MNLGAFQTAMRVLRRRPGRHDPADRVERGHLRRQPADVLDGPVPAAARPAAADQPALPHAGASRSWSSALIACVVIIPGQAEFLGTLYAFGAMLSFTIAHVSLIGLRWRLARSKMRKLPGDVEVEHEEAWYRAPFNVRVRGVDVPLFAVIGGLGTLRGLDRRDGPLHDDPVRRHRAGWRSGSSATTSTGGSKGLSLTETQQGHAAAGASARSRSAYAGVLVAFEEGTYSEDAMATALKLASHKGGDLRVIVDDHGAAAPRHRRAAARGRGDRAGGDRGGAPVGRARASGCAGTIVKVRPGEAGPPDRARGDRGPLRRDRDADAASAGPPARC